MSTEGSRGEGVGRVREGWRAGGDEGGRVGRIEKREDGGRGIT